MLSKKSRWPRNSSQITIRNLDAVWLKKSWYLFVPGILQEFLLKISIGSWNASRIPVENKHMILEFFKNFSRTSSLLTIGKVYLYLSPEFFKKTRWPWNWNFGLKSSWLWKTFNNYWKKRFDYLATYNNLPQIPCHKQMNLELFKNPNQNSSWKNTFNIRKYESRNLTSQIQDFMS